MDTVNGDELFDGGYISGGECGSGTAAGNWNDGGFSDADFWSQVGRDEKEAALLLRSSRLFALASDELSENGRTITFRKIKKRALKVAASA